MYKTRLFRHSITIFERTDNMDNLDLNRCVKVLIGMRDKEEALTAKYKAEKEKIEAQSQLLRNALLDYCKEKNLDSVKTESGTFYRTIQHKYVIKDWQACHDFVIQSGDLNLLQKRISQSNLKEYITTNNIESLSWMYTDTVMTVKVRKTND